MKKLLTLFTLLLTVCSGAWADETVTIFDGVTATSKTDASGTTYKSGTEYTNATTGFKYTCKGFKTDLVDVSAYTNHGSYNKAMRYGGSGASSYNVQFVVPSGYTADITVVYGLQSNATKYIGISTSTSASANGSNCTEWNASITANTTLYSYTKENLAGGKTYYLLANSDKAVIAKLEVTLKPSAPTISAQPQDANYVEGTSAGDVTALSVTATGTGDLYYQWFSNTSKSTTGAVSVQDKSKADGANTYKPSAATSGTTYYYCAVTDDNGTTNSDFATVVVSAASAPTSIEISGDNSAARGADDITLTAEVTGGVPTPTIEWFECDDALKTNPVSQGGASTSNTTFNVTTTTVGTYYYYAKATNTSGNIESAVKTITIVPKAPTITASASFVDSKDVTIAKADGEDASAVIKYSTDDGANWNDYSDAFNVTETTTVKAKVIQSGLESDVVSATYTKVTPHTWATVSAATTWDWEGNKSSLTTITIPENGSTSYGISRSSEDINLADFDGQVYSDNAGFPVSFKADALLASKFQNPSSSSGYFMGTSLKFQTTVPGIITVDFSNTGTSERPYRYLYVNGEQTTFKSKTSASTTNATNIQVPAGTVTIKGVMDPESSDSKAGTDQYLRIYKITFTPTVPVTVTSAKYATFASDSKLDFTGVTGLSAYTATAEGTTITFNQVTGSVPAGEGLLLYADVNENTTYYVPVATGSTSPVDNLLKRGTGESLTYVENATEYYILSKEGNKVGFYKANGNVVSENKAYLDLTETNAKSFALPGSETDGIRSIENSELRVENSNYYNLAGQRVGKDYKGIVIVNGKKMLNK